MSAAPRLGAPPAADRRRGWCPGALRPMASGDGLVLRIRPPLGAVPAATAEAIADLAVRYGDGTLTLTQRANLQLRAVAAADHRALLAALDGLGLLDPDADTERRRNILVAPLAGFGCADARPLAAALAAALAADRRLADLPAKFGFRVDDGSTPGFAAVAADVTLTRVGDRVRLGLAGANESVDVPVDEAASAAIALAAAVVDVARERGGEVPRMAAAVAALGARAILRRAGLEGGDALAPAEGASERPPGGTADDAAAVGGDLRPPIGLLRLRAAAGGRADRFATAGRHDAARLGTDRGGGAGDRASEQPSRIDPPRDCAVVAASPYGTIDAAAFAAAASASRRGAGDLRLTPWRSIAIGGLDAAAAAGAREALRAAGWIVDAADPRLLVDACPGLPRCASAEIDTRDLARRLAEALGEAGGGRPPDPSARRGSGAEARPSFHISGCAKGCARPGRATVALVGRAGLIDVVRDGRADDRPEACGLDANRALQWALGHARLPRRAEPARATVTARAAGPEAREGGSVTRDARAAYIKDGAEIYRRSFAIIRAEADLARFTAEEEPVAVRIVHACGMVEVAGDVRFAQGAAIAARAALLAGAPILCDARMVADGVTRARLPAGNEVVCTLADPAVADLAQRLGTTRSAAAMTLWGDRLAGAVVVVGNAPTALFHLLDMLDAGAPLPAAVIGMPVGFVGAAESKEALMADGRVPWITVVGRKGGSAMAAAAVNALASTAE